MGGEIRIIISVDVIMDSAAWPNAYADFALTLGRGMGMFKNAEEEASTVAHHPRVPAQLRSGN
ncbi:MAG: hypothetical protein ABR986_03680 [Methanomassiliicoccales archaeon]